MKRKPAIWHAGIVGFLLASILLIFFAHVLFTGRVLSASDMIFTSPFFAQSAPSGFLYPANATLSDQVYQFIPWRYQAWTALRQGRIPLWDPYTLAGRPFLATQQSAVFYPVNLVLTLLPFQQTFVWSAIIRLWIAGFTMYLLIRYYRIGQVGAIIAAISFMLSGYMIVWLGHPHTNVAIWLPALILCADILVTSRRRTTILRAIGALALVVGIQFTGGHIQTSLDILVAFGLYYVLRWFFVIGRAAAPLSKKLKVLVFPVVAFILGTGLAAIHLLPFIEWLPNSEILGARAAGRFLFWRPDFWKDLASVGLLIFPNLYSNPTWGNLQYYSPVTYTNYNEDAIYIGTVTFIFALIGLVTYLKERDEVTIWFIIAVISLGRAIRFPIFDWINQLPLFRLAVPARVRLIVIFGLCILAGYGVQALLDALGDARRPVVRWWVRLCIGVVVLGVALASVCTLLLPAYGVMVPAYFSNWLLYMPALVAGTNLIFFYCYKFGWWGTRLFPAALVVGTILDMGTFGHNYNPSVSPETFYPPMPAIEYMQNERQLFRFTAPDADLVPDTNALFSLSDIRGIDFRTLWYTRYINTIPGKGGGLYNTGFTLLDSPLIRALNIKYIVAARYDDFIDDQTLRLVARYPNVALWEVKQPQPRAFMLYNLTLVRDDREAAARLKRTPAMVYDHVIITQDDHPTLLDRVTTTPRSEVDSLVYQPEQATWRVYTEQAGYFFVSDAYYPGWKVFVDGQPSPLYRANLAFRAVYVPAGEHTVVFRYEPWYLWPGIIASLLGLLGVIGLWLGSLLVRDKSHVGTA